jgi:hypothetical protein
MNYGQQSGYSMWDSFIFGPKTPKHEKYPKKDQQRPHRTQQRRTHRRDQPFVAYYHIIGFQRIPTCYQAFKKGLDSVSQLGFVDRYPGKSRPGRASFG